MKQSKIRIMVLLMVILPVTVFAGELPEVKPSDVGMSAKKLADVDTAVNALVTRKRLAGAIVMVARHGKVVLHKSYGQMDIEARKPMRNDTIVRIYSMTKAITSVAALILHDEGKLDLDAPVSKYIGAFKGLEVYGKEGNVKPRREMIVKDLMRHTSGLTYGFFGNTPVDKMYREVKVMDRDSSLDVMCGKLGKIPLAYQPGKDWRYSLSVDVLGRVVEVVSKKSLDKFFAEHIFKPLDMKDTGFFVPDSKIDRFAANYNSDRKGKLTIKDAPKTSRYRKIPAHLSGGGGMVSTARDYMRFLVMIANGGELHGVRLLKTDTVKLMTTNQLPKGVGWIRLGYHRIGIGFGLGLSVRVKSSDLEKASKVGECGWGGAASTHFWISPADGLAVVTLEQIQPYSHQTEAAVKGIIYDAIENRGGAPEAKTAQAKADPKLPIAFVGKWDPYAAYDKKITDRIVMVKRPDCGSCHAKASLSGSKLHLVVNHGNKDDEWTIQGRPDGKTMVFKQGKIRIVLKDGKLTGKFTGKMHANIELASASADKNGQ